MKTVMFNGVEYPLSVACVKAHVRYNATRQYIYNHNATPQEAFDHMLAKKAAKERVSSNKLPAKPYERWTPPR